MRRTLIPVLLRGLMFLMLLVLVLPAAVPVRAASYPYTYRPAGSPLVYTPSYPAGEADTTQLNLMVEKLDLRANRALATEIIGIVAAVVMVLAAVGGSAGLFLFFFLIALIAGIIGLVNLIGGLLLSSDIKNALAASQDPRLQLKYQLRTARARTILTIIGVLLIINVITSLISSALSA
ncbi:MAG: hypothetical protein SF053_00705 [Bacteroidia bacterium]|nr:hypothetical protein [Bacteroidia bacterium]